MFEEKAGSSLKHQASDPGLVIVLVSFIVAKAIYSWFVLNNAQKSSFSCERRNRKDKLLFYGDPIKLSRYTLLISFSC